jgi:hypothetical protein
MGDVNRQIFQSVFPRWPTSEVRIGHVTNGIHTPSWESTSTGRAIGKAARGRAVAANVAATLRAHRTPSCGRCAAPRQALVDYARAHRSAGCVDGRAGRRGAEHAHEYGACIPALRSPSDYTPRLVPYHPAAVVPLEACEILWQR